MTPPVTALADIARLRRRHRARRLRLVGLLLAVITALIALTLTLGQSFTPPAIVLRVLSGQDMPGASFTILDLRLPRAVLAVLAGLCFGLGGVSFQTMLGNPLASPDIIGISSGAGAAAVFAIVILSLSGTTVSVIAVAAGLGVALLIYLLSWQQGVAGARLILVGIAISAMLQSVTAWILTQAPSWSLQEALRWMTGSINGATLSQALPLLIALLVFATLLLAQSRNLEALRLGDDTAAGLGVRTGRTRIVVICSAVALVAFATAATGPIAFVAFLSGPIATRLTRTGAAPLIPAACIGAILVLGADYAGQFLLPDRYPVGVVTGVLGAPYLIYLVIREGRTGGSA
ncbi:MAG: ABC transporter permease [Rhodobacteraceae bacterium]|nr:ABC transporter permease [Paracoccaceae bacterium]MAY44374.1 ABC transporter permease [Paracoccaceae bacterium]QEW18042.1 putative siderophore transport system permease protein YfhA [Marinibacterium anthonyi]